jgi:DNA helicase-2/ATP-dependent DNA helicase PcrA
MLFLESLNSEQLAAVKDINGAFLVLAGAGSGKTKALTHRIAYMIKEKSVDPESILAITFTNKAAKEMKERVSKLLSDKSKVMISTFHSFGVSILRKYIHTLGIDPNFNIYDVDDQRTLLSRIIKENAVVSKKPINRIMSKISFYKERDISPESVEINSSSDRNFVELFNMYESKLRVCNAIDFADILILTNKILSNKEILDKIQSRYKYVMVDEFQDTNGVQYEIIKKIVSKHKNIFVVGDENQSIYKFRGATISNILNFEKDFDAKVYKLERNYRSTRKILDASNSIIKNNTTSLGKNLWTDAKDGELIFIKETSDSQKESEFIVKQIKDLIDKGYSYKDIGILYRNNFQSRELEESLLKSKIPYRIYGSMQFYKRKEIKDILAYLCLIKNSKDRVSFLRAINTPSRGVGNVTVQKLFRVFDDNDKNILDCIEIARTELSLSSHIKSSLATFVDLLRSFIDNSQKISLGNLIEKIVKDIKYIEYLENDNEHERIANVNELIMSAKSLGDSVDIDQYLEYVSLAQATDSFEEKDDFVSLMTVHSSKGLEFKILFISGLEEELFPHTNSILSDNLEEERRLFYVALTRAKELLFLTYSRNRAQYINSSSYREKSRFIDEIPKELVFFEKMDFPMKARSSEALFRAIEDMKKKKIEAKKQIEQNTQNNRDKLKEIVGFSLGEIVEHSIFGVGQVISLSLDKIVVQFSNSGKKTFLSSSAKKFLNRTSNKMKESI